MTPRLRMICLAAAVVGAQAARGLAAGDVHVAVDATTGEARITGTASDDDIAITWDGADGAYTITGAAGTTIDGAAAVSVTGVKSFLVEMGAGNDRVLFDRTPVPRDLRVSLDDGDDALELGGVRVHGRTKIFGGPGADSIVASDSCSFRNSLVVKGGGGDDAIIVRNTRFHHHARLLGGPGDDRVTLVGDELDGGGQLEVLVHAGRDRVGIDGCTFGRPVFVAMGPGRDAMTLADTEFADRVILSGGTSVDTLWFGGGMTWSLVHPPEIVQFP